MRPKKQKYINDVNGSVGTYDIKNNKSRYLC